jgi:hypothetical protein
MTIGTICPCAGLGEGLLVVNSCVVLVFPDRLDGDVGDLKVVGLGGAVVSQPRPVMRQFIGSSSRTNKNCLRLWILLKAFSLRFTYTGKRLQRWLTESRLALREIKILDPSRYPVRVTERNKSA